MHTFIGSDQRIQRGPWAALHPKAANSDTARAMASANDGTSHGMAECAGLLYLGQIGAALAAAGIWQLIDADLPASAAIALVLAGGALALRSWMQARAVLDGMHGRSRLRRDAD